jgi:transcriptional regulator with XRE-family HTH domain
MANAGARRATLLDGAMSAQPQPTHLAEKLDRLFKAVHPRGRGEFTYREVAVGIHERGFASISPTYVWQLRTGQRSNPTMKHIEGLAAFFGVPVNYFFHDEVAASFDTELDLVVALRDSAIRRIALRSAGLSPESLAAIAEMIEHVRRLEGLTDQPESPVVDYPTADQERSDDPT